MITGAAGFLGRYLASFLANTSEETGIRQLMLTDLPSQVHRLEPLARAAGVEAAPWDVRQTLPQSLREGAWDYIIHAASIASPVKYRQDPLGTIDANLLGLRQLLDLSLDQGTRGLLFFSSSEVYGNPIEVPTSEAYPGQVSFTGPRACYDESKRLGETLCWIYGTKLRVPVSVVRPFNNFGPFLDINDGRLPSDLASDVFARRDLHLYSDGSPTRTFCYVSDAATGYLSALLHGSYDAYNIGRDDDEMSVRDFAETFSTQSERVLGYRPDVLVDLRNADSDYLRDNPQRRCPDISRARAALQFQPQVSVAEGVARYLRHLREVNT